ncbi:MAG: outer membrane lipoprotein carrier protein LolA [Bacteroidota bacterium]
MIKSFIIHSTLFALTFFLFFAATTPDKASQILESSRNSLETLADLSAGFQYGISHPGTRSVMRKGTVKYKPDDQFVIRFENEEIYCDGETIWINEKEGPVIIRDFEPEEGVNIETMFEVYRAKSDPRYDGIESVHGVRCHKIFLKLKDPSLEYNQAYLWINESNELPEKVVLIDQRQTRTTFEFTSMKTDLGLSVADFRFQVPSGKKIIDERY